MVSFRYQLSVSESKCQITRNLYLQHVAARVEGRKCVAGESKSFSNSDKFRLLLSLWFNLCKFSQFNIYVLFHG